MIRMGLGEKTASPFQIGSGRMPHPVGGVMGVTLSHRREKGITRFGIISLNIHKTTSRRGWHLHGCCTLTSTADFWL